MSKQTAVEWLVKQFSKHYAIHQLEDEIEQAKAMEKQQMKDMLFQKTLRPFKFNFEEYYNETYGK